MNEPLHGFRCQWEPVNGGRLTLYHRPGGRALAALSDFGCTRLVTLLSEREGALSVGHSAQNHGLAWTWLPLENGQPPVEQAEQRLLSAIPRLADCLQAGDSIMIHCAAGIHRTGMLAYALLRYLDYSPQAALDCIGRMRPHTLAGLQPRQINWGERVISQGRILSPTTSGPSEN